MLRKNLPMIGPLLGHRATETTPRCAHLARYSVALIPIFLDTVPMDVSKPYFIPWLAFDTDATELSGNLLRSLILRFSYKIGKNSPRNIITK